MSLLLLFSKAGSNFSTGRPPVIEEARYVKPPQGTAEAPIPKGKTQ